MLRELHIRNLAIIETLHLTFDEGFNVLTGETGAGKSILLDAVALLLGSRAEAGLVRRGASKAQVEGLFTLDAPLQARLAPLLAEEGLEGDDPAALWLSREVRAGGRSIARVNGTMVSVTLLRRVAAGLVDIHGQSEHLSLLRVPQHLRLLDRFGGLEAERQALGERVRRLRQVRRELRDLRLGERERMQRLDLLRFQVQEITAAAPQPGEIEALEAEARRLANAEQLAAAAAAFLLLIEEGSEETSAVLDLLGQAQREMAALLRMDGSLGESAAQVDEAVYRLEDAAAAVRAYAETIEFNPAKLAQVEERLALLRRLQRKYGGDLAEVLAHAERARAELERLESSDERIAELEVEEARLLEEVAEHAQRLSLRREEAARRLAEGVEAELRDLRMEGARFAVRFRRRSSADGLPISPLPATTLIAAEGGREEPPKVERVAFDATGFDEVEFLIAPNPGEGFGSLARIASGGETARLMLALKTVLARADETPTLIFDEIDQGIGGRIGLVVGEKLWRLTEGHQVLCVTHLPQLAAFGDRHFRVTKQTAEGRTTTRVAVLEGDARRGELAQMLGTQGEAALQGAAELLAYAASVKRGEKSTTG